MRPSNYQLFDFLDFNTELNEGERLWRACRPLDISVEGSDVLVQVPFQQQENSNEIRPDIKVPRKILTLRLRAYGSAILRLTTAAGSAFREDSPMLERDPGLKVEPLSVEKQPGQWTVYDGQKLVRAVVSFAEPEIDWWSDLQPAPDETFDLRLYPDGKKEIRLSAYDMFSPARHDAFALAYIEQDNAVRRMTCSFHAEPDECFFGTGERFAKMDLSGRTLVLYNQDGQGVNNRRTYKNVPFYLSSEGYGLFLHTSAYAKFSLADHSTRSAQILVDEDCLDVFLIASSQPERILYNYRCLTGFPQMPPLWSFGTWMSRMTYFSEEEVKGICERLRSEEYPCDVIHLDTGWFETDWLCEWKFNTERFPDPPAFIRQLKEKGFRVSLWQLPYIAYNAAQYEEARENNYICKTKKKIQGASNFSVQDYAGTIDFTYDKATEWYKSLLRPLLEMGVVCIKTDFGEDIHMDAEYHSMSPEKLRNLYPLLYQKAAWEVTAEVNKEALIWARAGWAGCQRYPVHWGGDSACSWDGLAGSLKGGLHLGLSGFGFWSHDVPGFHGVPDFMNSVLPEDIYVRWTQFGVFSSHLRYHGSHKREPWHYPRIAPIIKKWLNLRYSLIPYILEQSLVCTRSGFPLLRALYLHHPQDKICRHIDDQYYFGENMLVAPVMNSEGIRDVYLPEGEWIHFFSRKKYSGGRWIKAMEVPLDEMPVFVKAGSSIPLYPEKVSCTDEMDMDKVIREQF